MFYFHVVCGNIHMDLVRADNKSHAIAIVTAMFGNPTSYRQFETYKAIKA